MKAPKGTSIAKEREARPLRLGQVNYVRSKILKYYRIG
jgi:hypothetical protein